MRVHQFINSFGFESGGAERLVLQHHIDLRKAGVDAHLLAIGNSDMDYVEEATSLGYENPYNPLALLAMASYLFRSVGPEDLIHVHLFPASAYVAALSHFGLVRVPCVFTEHSTHNRRRESKSGAWLDRGIYKKFDRVFAISSGTEESLLSARPQLHGRTEVIPNGSNLLFSSPPKQQLNRHPTIISIGRLTNRKNFETALLAMAELGSRPFKYVVLGDGPESENLSKLSRSLGLEKKVKFEGHIQNIGPYLEAADIFLMPSRWEGFGLAAVEAMNAAIPLVASDIPGLREVTGRDGDCARLVSPDDPIAIANALSGLLRASPEERRRMGLRGHERSKLFDKSIMTKAYISAYKRLKK